MAEAVEAVADHVARVVLDETVRSRRVVLACTGVSEPGEVAGRVAAMGSAVYNMTKWGVVGFSEALRQEVLHVGIRVTCVEPGWVDTELQGHNENPMVLERMEEMRAQTGKVLEAEDIARAVVYAVSQPKHVSVNEMLVRPSGQGR